MEGQYVIRRYADLLDVSWPGNKSVPTIKLRDLEDSILVLVDDEC